MNIKLHIIKLIALIGLPLLFSIMVSTASAQDNKKPSLCEVLIENFWCPNGVINCLRDRFGATEPNADDMLTSCKDTFQRLLRQERGVVVSLAVSKVLLNGDE